MAKKLKDFTVTDINALEAAYPNFVKKIASTAKIRTALKLGIKLPGVELAAKE